MPKDRELGNGIELGDIEHIIERLKDLTKRGVLRWKVKIDESPTSEFFETKIPDIVDIEVRMKKMIVSQTEENYKYVLEIGGSGMKSITLTSESEYHSIRDGIVSLGSLIEKAIKRDPLTSKLLKAIHKIEAGI